MSENDLVKELLEQLAIEIDRPDGPGGGAICLDAIAALEELETRLRLQPAPPD